MPLFSPIVDSQARDIGFPIRRLLPNRPLKHIGPFIFLDHMGPAQFALGEKKSDVRPHPHIGLATVTYLFSGAFMHRDSLGVVQRIEPGAINLMTAGKGIVHSERIPEDIRQSGTPVEGLQMWLALPDELEECEPAFDHYPAEQLPSWQDNGARIQLLIGSAWGRQSPVKFPLTTFYAAVQLAANGSLALPSGLDELAIYVLDGAIHLGDETLAAGQLGKLSPSASGTLRADQTSRIILFGGTAPPTPRYLDWNFVSSRRERLVQAREDWKAQRFPMVPGETEFIPL